MYTLFMNIEAFERLANYFILALLMIVIVAGFFKINEDHTNILIQLERIEHSLEFMGEDYAGCTSKS